MAYKSRESLIPLLLADSDGIFYNIKDTFPTIKPLSTQMHTDVKQNVAFSLQTFIRTSIQLCRINTRNSDRSCAPKEAEAVERLSAFEALHYVVPIHYKHTITCVSA